MVKLCVFSLPFSLHFVVDPFSFSLFTRAMFTALYCTVLSLESDDDDEWWIHQNKSRVGGWGGGGGKKSYKKTTTTTIECGVGLECDATCSNCVRAKAPSSKVLRPPPPPPFYIHRFYLFFFLLCLRLSMQCNASSLSPENASPQGEILKGDNDVSMRIRRSKKKKEKNTSYFVSFWLLGCCRLAATAAAVVGQHACVYTSRGGRGRGWPPAFWWRILCHAFSAGVAWFYFSCPTLTLLLHPHPPPPLFFLLGLYLYCVPTVAWRRRRRHHHPREERTRHVNLTELPPFSSCTNCVLLLLLSNE